MKNLELTDDEAQALVRVLREAIDRDRFPLSQGAGPAGGPLQVEAGGGATCSFAGAEGL